MTAVEIPVEKWPGAVREVTLGSSYGGGTRTSTVTVGGETTLPFLGFEGAMPHRPALAVEVVDMRPGRLVAGAAVAAWGDVLRRPRRVGRARRRAGRRPHRPQAAQLPSGLRRPRRHRRRAHGRARPGRRRRAADRLRPRHRRQGQRGARGGRRGDQGRAARARPLRGEELPHHRGRGARQRARW